MFARRRPSSRWRDARAWLFLAPALSVLALFVYYPMVRSARLSLYTWNLLGAPVYVGAAQYQHLFASPVFRQSIFVTLAFTVGTGVTTYALSLATAVLLNQTQLRALKAVRTLALFPAVIPLVVVGLIWRSIYEPTNGLLNMMLRVIGIEGPAWLAEASLALPAIVVTTMWRDFGIYMLVLLGGLHQIPGEVLEAATIDRASPWQRFRYVTFPMLGATNVFVLVILLFNSLKVFDQIWLMTRGGPGNATLSIVTFIYTRLQIDVGLGAGASVFLFCMVMIPLALRVATMRHGRVR